MFWLFACFTQWKHVDEDEFRIHSDAPSNGAGGLPDSFEGKDEAMLSSSDEEATVTEDETETGTGTNTPNGLRIQVPAVGDEENLEQFMPTLDRADSSPTQEESPDYWADMNDELAEFLDEDGIDLDSDTESVASEVSVRVKTPPSALKRKRDADAEETELTNAEKKEGSRLQKRKKEALARTSSLTQMASVVESNGSTPAKGEDPGGGADGGVVGEEADEDDLEAMLAAELANDDA